MNEKVVILGGGESGVGAAILSMAKGYNVFLSDSGLISSKRKSTLKEHNIDFEEGQHDTGIILSATEIVKSPGIPDDIPLLVSAREKNILVISEIEFAMRHSKATFIGITGTNGKTTTTLLTYHLLNESGYDVGLAGNIGHSLARQVAHGDRDYFVIELSSFQLDGMIKARLHIAILLNITPDHLNRYNNRFELYAKSKIRIARNMRKEDLLIYNQGDTTALEQIKYLKSHVNLASISLEKQDNSVAYAVDKNLIFKEGDAFKKIAKKTLPMLGKHNMINSMAAIEAVRKVGMDWESISSALKTFRNAPHRLEYIGSI
ncbi:UNVERIFIED_CONTAM: hypothetical protein GTU68_066565, partial [Idotea baltica]|nr:hypothetical protein [Idotea baltica]